MPRPPSRRRNDSALASLVHAEAAAILEETTDAFFSVDEQWRFTYLNLRAAAYFGRPRDLLLGRSIWACFPEMVGSATHAHLSTVMRERRAGAYEVLSRLTGRWIEGHAYPRERGIAVFFRDITERKRIEQTLRFLDTLSDVLASSLDYRETLQRIATLSVGTLADGCIVHVEEEGRIRSLGIAHLDAAVEARLRELLRDLNADPSAGTPVADVVQTGQSHLAPAVDDALLGRAATAPEQLAALRALGIQSGMIVPMRARDRTVGAITFLRTAPASAPYGPADLELAEEVARRAAMAADNARLYDQAHRAVRIRDEVLGIVSHDLRNPVSAILLSATMLHEMVPAERWQPREVRLVETIRRAAEQMNALIQDLLEVTHLEHGAPTLAPQPTAVGTILDAAAEMFGPLAERGGLRFEVCTGSASRDLRVHADYGRVLQILSNLLGNALKFTAAGGTVRLDVAREDTFARFEVRDTGCGIAPEHLAHVFDRFWQARSAGRAGAGLGLAIARALVLAHGGRISVASEPGRGSTFVFTLRLHAE